MKRADSKKRKSDSTQNEKDDHKDEEELQLTKDTAAKRQRTARPPEPLRRKKAKVKLTPSKASPVVNPFQPQPPTDVSPTHERFPAPEGNPPSDLPKRPALSAPLLPVPKPAPLFHSNTTPLPDVFHFGVDYDPSFALAFPSISTTAYKFDLDIASTVACEEIDLFLKKHHDPRIRIFLVDLTESPTLKIFRSKAPKDPRFRIVVANLVELNKSSVPCHYIVNASNPDFSGGGSGTNEAIHRACTKQMPSFLPNWFGPLEKLTKSLYKPPATTGVAYPVDLQRGMPLLDTQQVHTVIHVVGPNMCPKRPNCLNGDYALGKELLRDSYKSFFECFIRSIEKK